MRSDSRRLPVLTSQGQSIKGHLAVSSSVDARLGIIVLMRGCSRGLPPEIV